MKNVKIKVTNRSHYFLENIIVRCVVSRHRLYTKLFNVALAEINYVMKLVGFLRFEIDRFPRSFVISNMCQAMSPNGSRFNTILYPLLNNALLPLHFIAYVFIRLI